MLNLISSMAILAIEVHRTSLDRDNLFIDDTIKVFLNIQDIFKRYTTSAPLSAFVLMQILVEDNELVPRRNKIMLSRLSTKCTLAEIQIGLWWLI